MVQGIILFWVTNGANMSRNSGLGGALGLLAIAGLVLVMMNKKNGGASVEKTPIQIREVILQTSEPSPVIQYSGITTPTPSPLLSHYEGLWTPQEYQELINSANSLQQQPLPLEQFAGTLNPPLKSPYPDEPVTATYAPLLSSYEGMWTPAEYAELLAFAGL